MQTAIYIYENAIARIEVKVINAKYSNIDNYVGQLFALSLIQTSVVLQSEFAHFFRLASLSLSLSQPSQFD